MKKTYRLTDLECAHCAAKIEDRIRKISGVKSVSVNFLAQRLVLEADDEAFDEVLEKAIAVFAKVEPDCVVNL